jgi:AcrR family transcriptional regulator
MKKISRARSQNRTYHHGDLRRALVKAALAIVTEEQDWAFSLREIARRAGVSHNAPYSHFADKNDLLAAVAAAGMEKLREEMQIAVSGIEDAATALWASGQAYVRFGTSNPALYRLIFGPAIAASGRRPGIVQEAGARTRALLEAIIERGARSGAFAIDVNDTRGQAIAVLAAWSAVHGLTLLIIDGIALPHASPNELIKGVTKTMLDGLRPR